MAVRIRRGKGAPVVVGAEEDDQGSEAQASNGSKGRTRSRAGSQQPSLGFGIP